LLRKALGRGAMFFANIRFCKKSGVSEAAKNAFLAASEK
jgi:hypothetical protein